MKQERRAAHRLRDILDAIAAIKTILHGKDYETFASHQLIRPAVERYFEIISEAALHLPASVKDGIVEIPRRKVADLGNVLRHAYHNTDPAILWDIYSMIWTRWKPPSAARKRTFPMSATEPHALL